MSKNSIYTFDYFQPKEYRFSLDSVFLAQRVAKHLENRSDLENIKVLDLCAGTGVIGLELSIHNEKLQHFDFIEIQEVYREYFEQNVLGIHGPKSLKKFNFILDNYRHQMGSDFSETYDIIVSNPPYFFKDEGLLSPSDFKNRCRFFLDADFKELICATINLLKVDGEAFLLVRPGVHHGRDLFLEIQKTVKEIELYSNSIVEIFDEVRGTNIIRLIKKS